MIEIQNLTFSYNSESNSKIVLDNINLNVKDGEFLAILGHNGSGKSTLAKHINAILLPCGGRVLVNGMDTANEDNIWDIRSDAAMVFQNPDNQIVATVVEDDVAFAAENLAVPSEEIKKRVDYALKAVGMEEFRKQAPHMLSGGQKQRIAIAGVIAMQPNIIVFDEPTAMLDPIGRKEVMKTILKLNREYHITIVLITHNMDEAALADRMIVMNKGKFIIDEAPKKAFSMVDEIKEIGLDVPQITYLVYLLRKKGINIRPDILTVDECLEELKKLCQ